MADDVFPDALPRNYRLHWYVLEGVLGQGGFGITYLARDTNLGRQVAIKEYLPGEIARRNSDLAVIPRSEASNERFRWGLERFIGEAQTLARFDHPNIVHVLAVFEANGTSYMVMRFEEGENLGRLLTQRGTLEEAEMLRILLPILDGLELVHQARFIHRDIKPENIHIRRDGSPVLLDFGSARQNLHRSHAMTILVARGYAPLEQYSGNSESQGAWTDIYSLAATCYRAIAGKAPADALERIKGVLGSVHEVLVPAQQIGRVRYSERVLKAIDHALELSEKDRPQSVAEWRAEILGDPAQTGDIPHHRNNVNGAAPTGLATQSPDRQETTPPAGKQSNSLPMRWAAGIAAIAAIAISILIGTQDQQNPERRPPPTQGPGVPQAPQRQSDAQKPVENASRQTEAEQPQLPAQNGALQRHTEEVAAKPAPTRAPKADKTTPATAQQFAKPAPLTKSEPSKRDLVPPPATDGEQVVIIKPAPLEPTRKTGGAEQLEKAEAAINRGDFDSATPIVKRLAAEGDSAAQVVLGRLYENGLGMPRNVMGAYMWYSLAARRGNAAAGTMKDRAAAKLQAAEIRQAERAVDNWQPRTNQ